MWPNSCRGDRRSRTITKLKNRPSPSEKIYRTRPEGERSVELALIHMVSHISRPCGDRSITLVQVGNVLMCNWRGVKNRKIRTMQHTAPQLGSPVSDQSLDVTIRHLPYRLWQCVTHPSQTSSNAACFDHRCGASAEGRV